MKTKAAWTTRLAMLKIVGLMLLSGCGGSPSVVNPLSPVQQANPPASWSQPPITAPPSGNPVFPTFTLLIGDMPPEGVAVLSFSVTVTGAVLEPGDVYVVTNPVVVEINRLQVETALLANLTIPSGTYTSLTVTFANPTLTILNNSGAANGSCASGAVCKLTPALAVSSVNLTGQPFPITKDPSAPLVLLLDFDLSKSLSNLATIDPLVSIQQTPTGVPVKQVAGTISYWGGDDIVDGALFLLVTDVGTINNVDDSFAQYIDATLCGGFFCTQGKIAETDLTSPSGVDTFWEARRVTLKPPGQPELEGVIVGINSNIQLDLVLLHQVPSVAGLGLGDLVRINLESGATIEAVDTDLKPTGLLFSAPSDLLIGQVVTARAQSAPSGTPLAVTADRVRLKSGALTGGVKSILSATDFVLDNLPGNFPSAQIQVHTNAQTGLQGISSVAALNSGDTVSLNGFLLKTAGDPELLAEGVRKR